MLSSFVFRRAEQKRERRERERKEKWRMEKTAKKRENLQGEEKKFFFSESRFSRWRLCVCVCVCVYERVRRRVLS